MAKRNVTIVQQQGARRVLRVDNPHWNKRLNQRFSAKGGGHRAVIASLQQVARLTRVTRVRYQPSNGKWYFIAER